MEWLAAQLQAALAGGDEFSRWLVGAADGEARYELTRWGFLRGLGVIYLIAVLSLWPQLRGLVGPHGGLPAQELLAAAGRCRAAGIGAGAISPVVAAVPPDLPVGYREADERRPHVAQSHGARLPLLDAAAPHLDRLVRESAPGRRQEADGGGHLSARDRRPVPDLRAPPRAACGLRGRDLDAAPDLRDWELQLLQSPHDRPRAPAGG